MAAAALVVAAGKWKSRAVRSSWTGLAAASRGSRKFCMLPEALPLFQRAGPGFKIARALAGQYYMLYEAAALCSKAASGLKALAGQGHAPDMSAPVARPLLPRATHR